MVSLFSLSTLSDDARVEFVPAAVAEWVGDAKILPRVAVDEEAKLVLEVLLFSLLLLLDVAAAKARGGRD